MGMLYELDDVEREALGLNTKANEIREMRNNFYRPSASELERSERQDDLIALFRSEY